MGDQSSQKPDQSPRSMFTLFVVRVLRASTHLHSLVHFLGIYQFDSVTFSLLYFLSGPTKYLKIFSLQIFFALKFSNISHEFQSLRSLAGLPTLAPSLVFICKISKLSQRGAQYRLPSFNTNSKWEKYSRSTILFQQKGSVHCAVHKPSTHSKSIL